MSINMWRFGFLVCVMIVFVQMDGYKSCIEKERKALLELKAFVISISPDAELDWSNNRRSNCCRWERIKCDVISRRIIGLSLNGLVTSADYPHLNLSLFHPFEKLKSLNLSRNSFGSWFDHLEGYRSFRRLPKLEILDLTSNGFNSTILPFLQFATSLKTLILRLNNVEGDFPMQVFKYMTRLEVLDLSSNSFSDILPQQGLESLHKLKALDISNNLFSGSLQGFCKLRTLLKLDVSWNEFEGQLPLCFASFTKLKVLDISSNYFNGKPPNFIRSLKSLEYLALSDNNFEGLLSYSSTNDLSKLKVLKLSSMSKKLEIEMESSCWRPGFQLRVLELRDCNLKKIPSFLWYQKDLRLIDLSNNKLSAPFPTWLLENNIQLEVMYLQYNALHTLRLPSRVHNLRLLDLSSNSFDDRLSDDFGRILSSLRHINLSGNKFKGSLPASVGEIKNIHSLDLSHNDFSGTVPRSLFIGCHFLKRLKLSHNRFYGHIFQASTNLTWLETLLVDNNMFTGSIGNGLRNSPMLRLLDMSNNFLTGTIPSWMGVHFKSLLELDPHYMYGLNFSVGFEAKQRYDTYISGTLGDLSRVRLLNLSHNFLVGSIPESLSKMKDIKSLDLSFNKLYGPIPISLTKLDSLAVFNVSYNNLSGTIPQGKQFNTFGENSYFGNLLLCGPPTNRSCDTNNPEEPVDDESSLDAEAFYWSLGVTSVVVVGFLVFMCFHSPWREGWCRLVRLIQNTCT